MFKRPWTWFYVIVFMLTSLRFNGYGNLDVAVGDLADRLYPLAGMVLGALWQFFDRRDVGSRLLAPAVLFTLGTLVSVVAGEPHVMVGSLIFALGLVSGLVLCEHSLRYWTARHPGPSGTAEDGASQLSGIRP